MNPHSAVAWKDGRLISIPPPESDLKAGLQALIAAAVKAGAAAAPRRSLHKRICCTAAWSLVAGKTRSPSSIHRSGC